MEFTLTDQTIYFLSSILFGVLLSALYEVVRALRFAGFNRLWQIVLSDILFFTAASVLTCLFALPFNKGYVRGFIIFGELIGFVLFRFTVGELTAKLYCFVIGLLKKVLWKISKITAIFCKKVLKAVRDLLYNIHGIIYKIQNAGAKRKSNRQKIRAEKKAKKKSAQKSSGQNKQNAKHTNEPAQIKKTRKNTKKHKKDTDYERKKI